MTSDEFEILAAKVLGRDATAAEVALLEKVLESEPARQTEFLQLQSTWNQLREVLAPDVPKVAPPRPHHLQSWREAVEAAIPARPSNQPAPVAPVEPVETPSSWSGWPVWLGLAAVILALFLFAPALLQNSHNAPGAERVPAGYILAATPGLEVLRDGAPSAGPVPIVLRASDRVRLASSSAVKVLTSTGEVSLRGPGILAMPRLNNGAVPAGPANQYQQLLQIALFQPIGHLPTVFSRTRGVRGLAIYSPSGFTENLQPLILWRGTPERTYDLEIVDQFAITSVPFRITNTLMPVAFATAWPGRSLKADTLYRLRIAEPGSATASAEITFRTLASANDEGSSVKVGTVASAYQMLLEGRIGDALAILVMSPRELAETEFVLRLKIFAFGQVGYQEDFDRALAQVSRAK